MQVSAAVRKMQEEVEARQLAEAEAARLAEEQRIQVCTLLWMAVVLLVLVSSFSLPALPVIITQVACVALHSICCV